MSEPGLRDLLQAGLHFGHQTRRWNPRMRRYIHGERDGIHIIDLLQTEHLLAEARRLRRRRRPPGRHRAVRRHEEAGARLGQGVGRALRHAVRQPALARRPADQLPDDVGADRPPPRARRSARRTGQLDLLPTKERMSMEAELEKLEYNLGGVRDMKRLPQAMLVIDLKTEAIAVAEAPAPADPDPRPGRLERRPGPGRLPDPRQRRLDPLLRAWSSRRSARDRGGRERLPRRRGEAPRRRGGAPPPRGRGEAQRREEEEQRREAEEAAAKAAQAAGQQAARAGANSPAAGPAAAAPRAAAAPPARRPPAQPAAPPQPEAARRRRPKRGGS